MTASGIAPASRRRRAAGAVSAARWSRRLSRPAQLGIPASAIDSLIVHGTPSSGGRASCSPAAAMVWSAASASASAASKRSAASALRRGWTARRRSTCACTTSRDETSPPRIAAARSEAERSVSRRGGAATAMARSLVLPSASPPGPWRRLAAAGYVLGRSTSVLPLHPPSVLASDTEPLAMKSTGLTAGSTGGGHSTLRSSGPLPR